MTNKLNYNVTNLPNLTTLSYDIDLQKCEGKYEVQLTKSLFKPKFEKKELSDVVEMIEQGALQASINKLRSLNKDTDKNSH